jgi:hypothetical protein
MGGLTPADRGYQLQVLVDRVAALETRLSRQEWQTQVVVSRATVTSTPGGGMVNVQFAATGQVKAVPYQGGGYTPASGNIGLVFDTGSSIVFVPVTAYL